MQGLEHTPTRELRALVTLRKQRGCTHEQIAESLDIAVTTLMTHYSIELRVAKEVFTDKVFGRLASLMESDNEMVVFNAQKFYLTHQGGWKSADKQIEVDANKELAAAMSSKAEADKLTTQLRGHLSNDTVVVAETKIDEPT